jgi:hypothetical protein
MSATDTRRDRRSNRQQVIHDNQTANDTEPEGSSPKTDLEAISDGIRKTLPGGKVRKVWDGCGVPGEATLVLAHRLLTSRVAIVLDAEKRSLKSIDSGDEDARKSAESYLAAVHKGTKQVKDLAQQLIAVAKTHSDITISGLPDEVVITGADSLLDAFSTPGPTKDAAPRQPKR